MTLTRPFFLAALASTLLAGAAAAQTAFEARVVDASNGRPIPAAVVRGPRGVQPVQADSAGRLRIAGIAAGTHRLRVQALGYKPADERVEVGGGGLHLFVLTADPVRVEGVVGRGTAMSPLGREIDGRRSRHHGSGRFLMRELLAGREASNLADVLRAEMPGVQFSRGRGNESYATNPRAQPSGALRGPPRPCFMQVFVDGTRIYGREMGSSETPPDMGLFPVQNIEAIEFYAHPSSTPVEYRTGTAGCGTIAIWMRRG